MSRDQSRVRVLLLARQAGEWWQRLEATPGAVRDLVMDAGRTRLDLADVIDSRVSAVDVVRQAMPYFAEKLEVEAPKGAARSE